MVSANKPEMPGPIGADGPTDDQRRRFTAQAQLQYVVSMLAVFYGLRHGLQALEADEEVLTRTFIAEVLNPLRSHESLNSWKLQFDPDHESNDRHKQGQKAYELACVLAAAAWNSMAKGESNAAITWSFICDATTWLGRLMGLQLTATFADHDKWAEAAAAARHAENRSMKAQVFEWCDVNRSRFPSMDATAEAIAGKVMPVTFRTARAWVGEWKRLRSTA